MFKRVLIANRGEIALRISRALRELGVEVCIIHGREDRLSLPVRFSDYAIPLYRTNPLDSYLDYEAVIQAAKDIGAEAIHPGYGFLSENVNFRDEVNKIGKTFIGPPSEAISSMGDKIRSKKIAKAAGVSVVPGGLEVVPDIKSAVIQAKTIGYPLMVKASAGGGGKGMRVAFNEKELEVNFNSAINEAKSSFGDERVFIEKFI